MRVLYVIDRAGLYGSEIHLFDLALFVSRQGNEVHVLSFYDGKLTELLNKHDIPCHNIKITWLPSMPSLIRLYYLFLKINPDVIHSHQPKAIFYSSIVARLANKPSVITIHSSPLGHSMQYRGIKRVVTRIFHFIVQSFAQAFSDLTIFVSNACREKSLFKDKSTVVHNWISPSLGNGDYKKPRQKCMTVKLLSISSLTYAKGLDTLIDFIAIASKYVDIQLDLYGTGNQSYVNFLISRAEILKVRGKIHFRGYTPEPQIAYKEADVFVCFSRSETFGLVFAEAMSFGLPVFGRPLKSLKEIVPEGNCLSEDLHFLAKQLAILTENPAMYEEVSSRNRDFAQANFVIERSASTIIGLYELLLFKQRYNKGNKIWAQYFLT